MEKRDDLEEVVLDIDPKSKQTSKNADPSSASPSSFDPSVINIQPLSNASCGVFCFYHPSFVVDVIWVRRHLFFLFFFVLTSFFLFKIVYYVLYVMYMVVSILLFTASVAAAVVMLVLWMLTLLFAGISYLRLNWTELWSCVLFLGWETKTKMGYWERTPSSSLRRNQKRYSSGHFCSTQNQGKVSCAICVHLNSCLLQNVRFVWFGLSVVLLFVQGITLVALSFTVPLATLGVWFLHLPIGIFFYMYSRHIKFERFDERNRFSYTEKRYFELIEMFFHLSFSFVPPRMNFTSNADFSNVTFSTTQGPVIAWNNVLDLKLAFTRENFSFHKPKFSLKPLGGFVWNQNQAWLCVVWKDQNGMQHIVGIPFNILQTWHFGTEYGFFVGTRRRMVPFFDGMFQVRTFLFTLLTLNQEDIKDFLKRLQEKNPTLQKATADINDFIVRYLEKFCNPISKWVHDWLFSIQTTRCSCCTLKVWLATTCCAMYKCWFYCRQTKEINATRSHSCFQTEWCLVKVSTVQCSRFFPAG